MVMQVWSRLLYYAKVHENLSYQTPGKFSKGVGCVFFSFKVKQCSAQVQSSFALVPCWVFLFFIES